MAVIRRTVRKSVSIVSALAVVAGLGGLMLSSCGKDDDKKSDPAPSTSPAPAAALTYTDVKSIIDTNCASSGCHTASGQKPPLSTEAEVKAAAVSSLARIKLAGNQRGNMPVGQANTAPAYDTTTDGKKLKDYLSGL